MRAILSYLKVCENCVGMYSKLLPHSKAPISLNMLEAWTCPDCISGHTLEVMEFELDKYGARDIATGKYYIFDLIRVRIEYKGENKYGKEYKNITKQLNPVSLTIIDEVECPECYGTGFIGEDTVSQSPSGCPNCNKDSEKDTGRIEKETLIVFDKDKYEAEIIDSLKEKINKIIPIGAIDKISRVDLGYALAQINILINGLTPKEREVLKALKEE